MRLLVQKRTCLPWFDYVDRFDILSFINKFRFPCLDGAEVKSTNFSALLTDCLESFLVSCTRLFFDCPPVWRLYHCSYTRYSINSFSLTHLYLSSFFMCFVETWRLMNCSNYSPADDIRSPATRSIYFWCSCDGLGLARFIASSPLSMYGYCFGIKYFSRTGS